MKRLLFFFVMLIVTTIAYGQKNVRQTASNYLREGKLDKALTAINQCINDPSTSQDPKTWLIRANIFLAIANSKDPAYQALDPDPINGAIASYKKTVEFDPKKDLFEEVFGKIDGLRVYYFNTAIQYYNEGNFKDAARAFVRSADMMEAVEVFDTTSLFNGALSAMKAEDNAYAKSIYLRMLKSNVSIPSIYSTLADIYRGEKNIDSAMIILKKGQEVFPDNLQLFFTETNIYLSSNETDKALKNLKAGIEKDPNNPSIYMVMGTIYDRISQDGEKPVEERNNSFHEAVNAYTKAIEIKPDYFDAVYNLGALYVNKAAGIIDEANKLPLDATAEFDKLTQDADVLLDKAMPSLEAALLLQPSDMNTMYSLKQIYARKKMNDKLKEINAKIDAAQGGGQ